MGKWQWMRLGGEKHLSARQFYYIKNIFSRYRSKCINSKMTFTHSSFNIVLQRLWTVMNSSYTKAFHCERSFQRPPVSTGIIAHSLHRFTAHAKSPSPPKALLLAIGYGATLIEINRIWAQAESEYFADPFRADDMEAISTETNRTKSSPKFLTQVRPLSFEYQTRHLSIKPLSFEYQTP